MLRLTRAALVCLAIVGCHRGAPPSPPPAETDSTASTPAATPPTPAPPAATSPVNSKPLLSASPLRELAVRYLDSDGQGGWRTNEKAATELEKLSPDEVAQLWPLLKDPQVEVRRGAAVFLLTQFNAVDSEQVAAFAALLDDSDRMVRARALDAARQFAPQDKIAALPRLTAMLNTAREARAENRAAVARICASLKVEAAAALPALESACANDADARVRAAALAAIAQIATADRVVAPLSKALSDTDASVRLA